MTDQERKTPSSVAGDGGGDKIASVEAIMEAAPKDIKEEVLTIPEWDGLKIKVKSFTAAQQASVKQKGIALKGDETLVAWANMEIHQFQMGVVEPKFSIDQVKMLHAQSGAGFRRIIDWLDETSGIDKEKLRDAQREFLGTENEPEG